MEGHMINVTEIIQRVQQGVFIEDHYLYSHPSLNKPVFVAVEAVEDEMYVRFFTEGRQIRLSEVPLDATFELITGDEK